MLIPVDSAAGPVFPSKDDLEDVLGAADELSLVIRAHQLIDACATRFLYLVLPAADISELSRLTLTTKMDVVIGTGRWGRSDRAVFVGLDRIRNAFAHRRDAELASRVADLRGSLGPWMRKTLENTEWPQDARGAYELIVSVTYVCLKLARERIEHEHEEWRTVDKELQELGIGRRSRERRRIGTGVKAE